MVDAPTVDAPLAETQGSRDNGRLPTATSVGIVGGGQLARMTLQAANAMGIAATVLAEHPTDSAATSAARLLLGSPNSSEAMDRLASQCGVVTFDHEQVDLGILEDLERRGHLVRPGPGTLQIAVDKAAMRYRFARAGIAVPSFEVLEPTWASLDVTLEEIDAFAERHGWPLVLKAVRGGYDGKGVWLVPDRGAAGRVCRQAAQHGTALLVEEAVDITAELAVLVARRPDGPTGGLAGRSERSRRTGSVVRWWSRPGYPRAWTRPPRRWDCEWPTRSARWGSLRWRCSWLAIVSW